MINCLSVYWCRKVKQLRENASRIGVDRERGRVRRGSLGKCTLSRPDTKELAAFLIQIQGVLVADAALSIVLGNNKKVNTLCQ